ncbi:hypothetical protein JHK86_006486 [Glycine max]|nr:hypothetical protein JHK86_006486 [Glycine max]
MTEDIEAERDSIGGKGEEGDGDAVVDHKGSDRVQNMALESYEGGELFDQITRNAKVSTTPNRKANFKSGKKIAKNDAVIEDDIDNN